MDLKMISPHKTVKTDDYSQPLKVLVGSATNFKSLAEPDNFNNRPLMVNAWSQTNFQDFSILHEIILRDRQSQREEKLVLTIKALEENLRAHEDLLSKIHATSARSSVLSSGQHQSNIVNNNTSNINNFNTQSPQAGSTVVNVINATQPVTQIPAESVKYNIIAESTGNNNDGPIEFQLAEDESSLNLNSSADSGRLEICLTPEENTNIKTEENTNTLNNMPTQQYMAPNYSAPTTPNEHQNFIKKRRLTAAHYALPPANLKCENGQSAAWYNGNMPQGSPSEKLCNNNNLLQTPKMQNGNINNSLSAQETTTPIQSADGTYSPPQGEAGIDIENIMVSIGPNNTRVPAKIYYNINWSSASIATRKLLMAIFDRQVLATHSMTGKPSPAFKGHGKPVKEMLDPLVIADIIHAVTRKCNVSNKEVRNAITTKCADENKMMKLQMNKRIQIKDMNKENLD